MSIQKLIIILSVLCGFYSATAQNIVSKVEIRGKIVDERTNEALEGVSVALKGATTGTVSDRRGRYTLRIDGGGQQTLVFSCVGYTTWETSVETNKSRVMDVRLVPLAQELSEVIVSARAKDENLTRMNMGVEQMTAMEIRRLPVLMGEVDLLKAIQLLPGVQATGEGSSGFSVRGGSPDQNLILLDNTTLYNPSHLFGFFSTFNNDVVEGLELYKGDMPLKYGGRLSSLLKVDTKAEIPSRLKGTGGVGLISSRLTLEGPAGKRSSWMIGGRRSYADLFLKLSGDENINGSTLYFYDLNAKITHRFSSKDRLELNGYYGRDVMGAGSLMRFSYGNAAAALTWGHTFSDKLYSKVSLHAGSYNYAAMMDIDIQEAGLGAGIFDLGLRVDFKQHIDRWRNFDYGVDATLHNFRPDDLSIESIENIRKMEGSKALEYGVYLSNEQKWTDRLSVRYGVRLSVFQNMGKTILYKYDVEHQVSDSAHYGAGEIYNTYLSAEPRAGLVYLLNEHSSVKANYARNTQFVQLAENSSASAPVSTWFPASPNIKPQNADIFSAGYFLNLQDNMFETSVEAYYKALHNVIDFAEHSDLHLNPYLESEIRTGEGRAYGVELSLKKNSGRLTGFVNYTLSRSERSIPEINNGKTYLAPYDKTHAINISLNYALSRRWSFSAAWIFASGMPVTYPTGRFEIGGEYFPIYSGRNEYRKPAYHRLDLSLNFVPKPDSKKRWKGEWNFSIYNAYARKNPWMITFRQADTPTPTAEMIYLFGVVPSVTYNFKF